MQKSRRLKIFLMTIGAVLALAVPRSASGAITLGATFTPTTQCSSVFTFIQASSTGDLYAAPSNGVITSWAHLAAANPPALRFKVVRPLGGGSYALVAESGSTPQSAGVLNRFPVRIPVQRGDTIGFFFAISPPTPAYPCAMETGLAGDVARDINEDVPFGATSYPETLSELRLDVSAQLEPDADRDGFGDETQDQCPSDASTQRPCPPQIADTDPPETTINKAAPKKTHGTTVMVRFRSDEAGSTFECRLDKKPWKPCTSPKKLGHLRTDKHKFKVRAKDPAGNVDPSPAKDNFTVVK